METQVGSGMNGVRSEVRRPLAGPKATIVAIEHRGRPARMNAGLADAALSAHGRRLVMADDGEVTDDLVRDMLEGLTSFCARLYGQRPARNRTPKAPRCAQRADRKRALTAPPSSRWAGAITRTSSDQWAQDSLPIPQ